MRSKQGLLFLIIALLCFSSFSVHSQEKMTDKNGGGEHLVNSNYDHQESGISKAHDENKFGHGTNGGGTGGGGGSSHSPYMQQGGGGAIPVYAAGARNNNHHHHGGVNHRRKTIITGSASLTITTTFACLFLLLCGS